MSNQNQVLYRTKIHNFKYEAFHGRKMQGWDFIHRVFEQIARFLWAKEQKSDSLVKKSKLLLSLFCHERPEQIAHGCSFVKSDKSALFNMSNFERKSEFPTLKKCKTLLLSYCSNLLNSNNKLAQKSISWSSFKRLRFFHFLNSLHRTCSHIVWFCQPHVIFKWAPVSVIICFISSHLPSLRHAKASELDTPTRDVTAVIKLLHLWRGYNSGLSKLWCIFSNWKSLRILSDPIADWYPVRSKVVAL